MGITFAKPPVNEVVLGQTFIGRPDFLIPHYGEFWALIRDEYPECQHAAPVFTPGQLPFSDATAGVPLPRVWLTSADGTRLVQLQQDRFYVNWRQTEKSEPYIRFPAIRAEHDRLLALFESYIERVTGRANRTVRHELTYVNLLPQGEGWNSYGDLNKVLKDWSWPTPSTVITPSDRFLSQLEFNLPQDAGSLVVKLQTAKRTRDGLPTLKMELIASSNATPDLSRDRWTEVAHEAIVQTFKELTTSQMHQDHWFLQGA
jgi:uncharacterized protein (TIGR04255 family)